MTNLLVGKIAQRADCVQFLSGAILIGLNDHMVGKRPPHGGAIAGGSAPT